MANLHFHYGTMGSSKSAQLIINAYNFNRNGTPVAVIKPAYDNRFDVQCISSRIGISIDATPLKNLDNYKIDPNTRVLLVDEVQFFAPSDIDHMVDIADTQNVIVMAYGLMIDSNERIFPAARRLIEVGAKLHRMESNCQIPGCLSLATHHLRFDASGNVIRDGDRFQLGDTNFKSVCRHHFNEIYRNNKSREK